jgi:hypothetical protein
MVLTPQDFERGLLAFPQPFLSSILESVWVCNPTQWGNFPSNWLQQPKGDCIQQGSSQAQAQGTPGDAPGTNGYWGNGMTCGRGGGNGTGRGGGADKAGVGVGDLEALSNKRPMAKGEERRMVGTHGGPTPDGHHPPTTCITQKLPR